MFVIFSEGVYCTSKGLITATLLLFEYQTDARLIIHIVHGEFNFKANSHTKHKRAIYW